MTTKYTITILVEELEESPIEQQTEHEPQYSNLLKTAGEGFINWMNIQFRGRRYEEPVMNLKEKYSITEMFKRFKSECNGYAKCGANAFTNWVKLYCIMDEKLINAHKNGLKDIEKGIHYWTFSNFPKKDNHAPYGE